MKLVNVKPNIYSFFDSRKYLQTFYDENKKANPAFSFRSFSQLANLKSYNYLSLVIDGKRRLSATFLGPFAKALQLNEQEKIYFSRMIEFTEEEDSIKKQDCFRKLIEARPPTLLKSYDQSQMILCEEWYHLPIVELTQTDDFQYDSEWMAERLGLRKAQVEIAVEKLVNVGLLKISGTRLVKTYQLADTSEKRDRFGDLMVNQYHHQTLLKASQLVLEFEPHQRELGAITAVLDQEQFQALKLTIKEFRQQVFAILKRPALKGEDVYQINFQLLPVTKLRKELA